MYEHIKLRKKLHIWERWTDHLAHAKAKQNLKKKLKFKKQNKKNNNHQNKLSLKDRKLNQPTKKTLKKCLGLDHCWGEKKKK